MPESSDAGRTVVITISKAAMIRGDVQINTHGDSPEDICLLCKHRGGCDGKQVGEDGFMKPCAIPCG